jgi:hypothetical protein
MQEVLSRIESHDIGGLAFFVLALLAGLIIWLSLQWRLNRRTELEVALKQDMLNRGMLAEEIERVLRAPLSSALTCESTNDNDGRQIQAQSEHRASHPT